MRYPAALKYLFSFLNFERLPFRYQRDFNLKRMACLLDWFGHPEHLFPSVLVAGTKGKGSTANFLASVLIANRYSAGLYTSPHLNDPRERIKINGHMIPAAGFAKLVARIRPVIERRKKEIAAYGPITFFEIFTLLAILYFASKKVNLGIFEVGMGGRLDATNVLEPLVSVITPISFDHEEHLGKTLSSIAREKAAIIKRAGCVVSADQMPEAMAVLQTQIRRQKVDGYFLGHSFYTSREWLSKKGSRFDFTPSPYSSPPRGGEGRVRGLNKIFDKKRLLNLRINLPGTFQIQNAAVALATAGVLENQYGFSLHEKKVRAGLRTAFWPGRFEIVERGFRAIILDGAHNGASMNEVCLSLEALFPKRKRIVIFGTSREKSLVRILKPLLPVTTALIVTKSNNPRAQEPKVILETVSQMGYRKPTFWSPDFAGALQIAARLKIENAILLITGSLFLIGEAREVLICRKFI